MSEYETLIYETQDHVALITMNRPDKRNALNAELNADLLSAFQEAAGRRDHPGRCAHRGWQGILCRGRFNGRCHHPHSR